MADDGREWTSDGTCTEQPPADDDSDDHRLALPGGATEEDAEDDRGESGSEPEPAIPLAEALAPYAQCAADRKAQRNQVADLRGWFDGLSSALEASQAESALGAIVALLDGLGQLRDELVGQIMQESAARLAAVASGNGTTHDWSVPPDGGMPRCRRCRTRAIERCIEYGQVPVCSPEDRCPLGWHEIASQLGAGWKTAGECIFCKTVYPTTAVASAPERTR